MSFQKIFNLAAVGLVAGLVASPAIAQKSKDTLRFAINDPFSALDPYQVPHEEAGYMYRTTYNRLIGFNEREKRFEPELAKSWKRISPTTIEFELRDDVEFHTGNKFTAQDFVYLNDWLSDPKVRIRFKARFTRIKEVQVLGPYKIRIVNKAPNAVDLLALATRYYILDSKVHKGMENKTAFGRVSASTTGPYKVTSFDTATGIKLTRNEKFFGSSYHPARIKNLHARFIPDRQTQQAQLFTGGLEVIRDITADTARNLKNNPRIAITATSSQQIMYITLDAAGRSEHKVMTDKRVRQAMMKAINREAIINTFVAGGKDAERPDSICFKLTRACDATTTPLGYDPAGAKKLLAEAGYPNGFDLKFYVYEPIREIGEAIAGDLRKIGIKASIQPLKLQVYVKLRGQGKFTAFLGKYPTNSMPDVDNVLNFFFGANRDYYKDPIFNKAWKEGATEFDLAKRTAIYQPALDRLNEESYLYPFSENPVVYAHTKDVVLHPNPLSAAEVRLGDYGWK